ncbi:tRNA (adenosine(37)-N6)-threonylcarbamoyltransferase complex ATPase subunit type 1 TsaE [Persephonella atlantica]|uniref:tRNA threonylcarbamoyladenosine biosynthesis protein TsaE n=1 Tax=Persephonella atlantica TaxID=2699429 RepID=A0ABS1GGV7_9AQUI|nr:tRNA (adenosine(37)-N6)-threonylcarbamoyltransferase complex ATPase subunit type 1 TsaE [Persephonella atlantica]MBK3332174.1 tRNA (adenosine(37)-N6)-threonylcarbamoyltransferase complex ATPase subunit type 1 TsaE [Persephonella atlantica]
MFEKRIKIKSPDQLKQFASTLSSCLKGNELILLTGDLGSGKTTFTKFLVSSIDSEAGEDVNSPTFSIMNVYETDRFPIYHIDLYRVKQFDLSDVLDNGLVIVEWPDESMYEIENTPILILDFFITEDEGREINIRLKNADYVRKCIR